MIVGVRPMTPEEKQHLEHLNHEVKQALSNRRKWLDQNMHDRSPLKPGDDIYDVDTGRKLGVVSKLYRYHQDRHEGIYDDHSSLDFEYETSHRGFSNTSSQYGMFGSKEEAARRMEQKREQLIGNH